jgi:benzoate-CoA ligase family protein
MEPRRSIIDYLTDQAHRSPDHPIIYYRDQQLTVRQLEEQSARCRGVLRALGVGSGDRVALVMSDCPDMVVAMLGVMGLGAIAVPCSTMLRPAELAYIFNDSGARCAIVTPDQLDNVLPARPQSPSLSAVLVANGDPVTGTMSFAEAVNAAPPAPLAAFAADTPCLVLYTSGSTGAPKGAVHRHGHLSHTVECMAKNVYELTPDDRLFSSSRLFFAYGFGNSFSFPIGTGAATILCSERPAPALITGIFERYRPTVFFSVPAIFRALLEHLRQGHPLATGSLRFCVSAGESLPAGSWHEWKAATGVDIIETIGTTELLHGFISSYKDRIRPGSCGVATKGYDIRLLDTQGQVVEGAGRGDLYVRGASAIPYYLNKPEKTAESIREGWVRTGDVFRRDEDGFYWFEGRSDDLFKSSGMWVSPGEVEDAICGHAAVLEAAVIAETDASGSNVVAAYVALRPGHAPAEALAADIKEQAAKNLPRYKRPQRIHFMEQLPRTATGKVQRFKLREMSLSRG